MSFRDMAFLITNNKHMHKKERLFFPMQVILHIVSWCIILPHTSFASLTFCIWFGQTVIINMPYNNAMRLFREENIFKNIQWVFLWLGYDTSPFECIAVTESTFSSYDIYKFSSDMLMTHYLGTPLVSIIGVAHSDDCLCNYCVL